MAAIEAGADLLEEAEYTLGRVLFELGEDFQAIEVSELRGALLFQPPAVASAAPIDGRERRVRMQIIHARWIAMSFYMADIQTARRTRRFDVGRCARE
eukprot:3415604-Pyramimonas_sp.AAC.1